MNMHHVFTHSRIKTCCSELIGDTPLYELARTGTDSRLLLKLEQCNPTGSCKVRMAREMVLAAERDGLLKPGGEIVEPTSGNTGLGLALVSIERGYKFTAIVDGHASRDKLRAMEAMGVNLVFIESDGNGPSTVKRRQAAKEISERTGAFWPDQHYNPNNNYGYRALARELLTDLGGDIDYIVGAVGTGGTLCGTVSELRRLGSPTKSIGVEPVGSIIFGGPAGKYWQTGSGAPGGFTVGPNVDLGLIDEKLKVNDVDAFTTARVVARRTGLLVGGTAGAAIHIALKRLVMLEPESTLVVLVCDTGEKYLDSVYNDDWLEERSLLDPTAHRSLNRLMDAYIASTHLPPNGPQAAR
ncbi:PLP-dependent cysteine synthase family protein [Roseibium sp. RKSG952]|uniref:PLP-dependent cysteine synthase family protein n=1 Tax=Roseibium sp. RKSG952 TaxID=2529384 RepID=UPI0012BD51C0|nr:cysteine synthase family protein [Roseibium sp. RKSG952]MTH95803.1 cysteine synthase family protein [Roseibium sp. RKSG952]